jgi:hypothetical protein
MVSDSDDERIELRRLLVEYLVSCASASAEACWYRLDSCSHNFLPDGETKALLPSMSDMFRLSPEMVNNMLEASGLMKRNGEGEGEQLTVDVDSWNDMKTEHNDVDIDIEFVSHATLIGEKVAVIRIGYFDEDPFDALALAKKIEENKYTLPRMYRFRTKEQMKFCVAAMTREPVAKEEIDDDDDDDNDSDSDSEDASSASENAPAAAAVAAAPTATTDAEDRNNDSGVFSDSDDSDLVFKSYLEVAMALEKAKAFVKKSGYPKIVEEHIEHAAHEMRVHRLKRKRALSPSI